FYLTILLCPASRSSLFPYSTLSDLCRLTESSFYSYKFGSVIFCFADCIMPVFYQGFHIFKCISILKINDTERKTFSVGKIQNKKDRKSTRLNSSHVSNSYAVFCLKK